MIVFIFIQFVLKTGDFMNKEFFALKFLFLIELKKT